MTQTGEVIRWDAERGFGFIATADSVPLASPAHRLS